MSHNQLANLRRKRDAIKRQFPCLFDAIEHVLERHDPMGIPDPEVPDREAYAPEVGTILPWLVTAESVAHLEIIFQAEFQRWFGASANRLLESEATLPRLAHAIWDVWVRIGRA